jgi:AraC-like DNA-binding protein
VRFWPASRETTESRNAVLPAPALLRLSPPFLPSRTNAALIAQPDFLYCTPNVPPGRFAGYPVSADIMLFAQHGRRTWRHGQLSAESFVMGEIMISGTGGTSNSPVASRAAPAARLPLSRFEQLHTADADLARDVLAGVFCPHRLTVLDRGRQFEARFHTAHAGGLDLCYLDFGGEVYIAPDAYETFHLVVIPLAGRAEFRYGCEHVQYDSSGAGVPPTDRPHDFHVSTGTPHLIVRIARHQLEAHLRSTLARPVAEPVRFAPRMDMAAPPARSWRRLVTLLLDEVDDGGPIPIEPLAMRELERLFLTQLLLAQPSNYSAQLHEQPPGRTAPRTIRRAAEIIQAHAAEPLTVEDIAEAAGLPTRTLQEGFRRHLDTTPMHYLREIRLRHVRDDLIAASPARTTVTEIATRWGFLHAGRFSEQYRQLFDELPSTTLRH